MTEEFDKIRPYFDEEVQPAISRMLNHPFFNQAMNYLFSQAETDEIVDKLKRVNTSFDFQKILMYRAISRIIEKSSTGFHFENSELLKEIGPSVFVANHRDILLDSAILQLVLVDLGLETSEITFGSNLMINDFIVDFGKTNRMYTVFREGSAREMLENSKRLSAYIHYTITQKKRSSWIAQRKGRTKNGLDQTDSTVLKMLTTYKRKMPVEAIRELNIVPVVMSYEFEPCDLLKIKESYFSKNGNYTKKPGEDLQSILTGIAQQKGEISLKIGQPVNDFLESNKEMINDTNVHQMVANYIDKEVYSNYKLYPNNYWALDQLNESTQYSDNYNSDTENRMLQRLEELYSLVGNKDAELKRLFLEMYANPLIQKQKLV